MLLENSRDLLNIVLAFAIVWLTVFLCWLLYYVVMVFKNTKEMIEEVRGRFRAIEEGIRAIRERFEHASASLTFISEGVVKLIQYFVERRREKTTERAAGAEPEEKSGKAGKKKS